MSADISIVASRRELALLIEHADYLSDAFRGSVKPLILANGDILDHHDPVRLWSVLNRQEFLFPKTGLGIVRVPSELQTALEKLRRSMTNQGVGVRASKLTGTSLVQRIAEGILLAGRTTV